MLKKKEKAVRSNTWILAEHYRFVRDLAKRTGHTQREVFREIIQFYIDGTKSE